MSDVQKQIEENRRNAAVQRMNETLAGTDQPGTGEVKPHTNKANELPLFGVAPQKVVQNLKERAEKP